LAGIILPIAVLILGAAIDMSPMHSTSRYLQDIVDNAALAAVSAEDMWIQDKKKLAEESLRVASRELNQNLVVKSQTIRVTEGGDTVSVKVGVEVPQYFGAFLGKGMRNVSAENGIFIDAVNAQNFKAAIAWRPPKESPGK